jgi:hypothetical protein
MARTFAIVQNAPSNGLIPLDMIPDDVKADVENAWTELSKTNGRMHVTFDSPDEAKTWLRQAASYCGQRPNEILKFRVSPTRNLPENEKDFRITRNLPDNGKENAERNAAKK